ncbi:MAG: Hpt domain-containing protein, partial [Rhodanobacter sp.]
MRLQDHIDFTTLQWVKPELDDTLSIAREALESYVDNPAKRDFMLACADHLHQVHGTLKMVQLYGAAMVTAEMETLAGALLDDQVPHREEAYAALMRGLMQLPDYLERLSSGHRDVPVVLLPLLNDLRGTRGQEPMPESAMFHPNLDAFLPEKAPAAMSEAYAAIHRPELSGLRLRFQHQLLAWFRGQDAAQQLVNMRKTLLAITARCFHVHGRRLWWIAAGVLEGLEQGMLKGQAGEVRQLIGKVDRNIRLLIEHGENSLRSGDADEVACKLLYLVAQAKQRSPHMEQLRTTYALDSLVPDAGELEHARGSMSGHNRALLDSVSRALKDDLLRVKEALDLFLRQQDADPAQLAAQGEVLERVGDTLGMLALAVPRRVVSEQRRVLDEIANRMRPADEESLLDVAGALLYVEASLDDHIESLGSDDESAGTEGMLGLPRSEALSVVSTLMQEAISNTGGVKDAIVAFVESGWEHDRLAGAPLLMDQVAGAMRMLSSPRPGDLAQGVGHFIDYELLQDRRVPSGAQMDHLADALAALEYYLEAAREHRGGLEHILDVAEHSLAQLGYWPLPDARVEPEAVADATPATSAGSGVGLGQEQHPELTESVSLLPGDDLANLFIGQNPPTVESAHDINGMRLVETESTMPGGSDDSAADQDWVEVEEEVVEQVPVADPLAANTRFNIDAEGIDDDIREIFLEEMQEEIDNLSTAEKGWLADLTLTPSLVNIRRSFHTLKGSGRLVGAGLLGEFAWKVEDMLNRVLDKSIEPTQDVQDLVHHAIEALPQLLAALKGEATPDAPLSAIMRTAEELAAGHPARLDDQAPRELETVRRTVVRRVPRSVSEAADVPQAGLTEAAAAASGSGSGTDADEPRMNVSVMPPVDPVLLEILRSEVTQYLHTIRNAIQRSENELPISEELLRAVHTLHGAVAMVDVPLLTQVLSPLEGLFKRLRASGDALSAPGVELLQQAADQVDQVMGLFGATDPLLPNVDKLAAQITEMRDNYPESQIPHVVFEPREHEEELWESAPDDVPVIDNEPIEALDEAESPDVAAPLVADQHAELTAEMAAALSAFEPAAAEQAAAEQA